MNIRFQRLEKLLYKLAIAPRRMDKNNNSKYIQEKPARELYDYQKTTMGGDRIIER